MEHNSCEELYSHNMCVISVNGWKSLKWKRSQNYPGNDQLGFPESFLFCMVEKGPRGMFWLVVAQFGPPGTPRKSAFFQERGRKRMKELGEVTFTKEWDESPQWYENFGTNAFKKSCFVSEIRSFEKKSAGINKSVIVNLGFCWLAILAQFSYGLLNGA